MKKLLLLALIITTVFSACEKDDEDSNEPTEPVNETFVGSLINPTATELQEFYDGNYKIIKGDVKFEEDDGLRNLFALSKVEKIEGSFSLINNQNLESLDGLNKLSYIGQDFFFNGQKYRELENIDDLESLIRIGGSLTIINAFQLKNLEGLKNLESIGEHTYLRIMPNLQNIDGLNNVQNISGNIDLYGLSKLESLNGLSNLTNVGGYFYISNSIRLYDYCAIKDLVNNDGIAGTFITFENQYNPTIEDFNNGNCSGNPVIILDGIYIKGAGTAITEFDTKGMMRITRNEVTQEDRANLVELFVAVKAGTDGFNIITVEGSTHTTLGPGDDFNLIPEIDLHTDEPKDGLWRGSIKETTNQFTVPEDGLYHIMYDTEIQKVAIAKVNWGIIGSATAGGWSESTPLNIPSFNLETMTYMIPSVTMQRDDWKFRYSSGWKVILDPDFNLGNGDIGIKVNANLGGEVSSLIPGGQQFTNDYYANYKITLTYHLGQQLSATFDYESEAEQPSEYPEALFLVGAATAYGWETPGTVDDAIMHKVAGGGDNEGIYWKILHLEVGDQGFKISAENWGTPNIGYFEVDEFDPNGVEVINNDANMGIATSGMYMVVVDLRNDMTKLSIVEPEVYGIGDAFGTWNEDVPANLFQIDNDSKTIISPSFLNSGSLRMYVSHEWIPAWWNSEFNVFSSVIEYRNDGGDQDLVATTTGQAAILAFDDNTGTIQ